MNSIEPSVKPTVPDAHVVLEALWQEAGLPPAALQRIVLSGREPVLPTSFALGTALQAGVGAAALAAAEFGLLRGEPAQTVSVDICDAVRESACRFTIDGHAPPVWEKLSGLYRCGGKQPGGWIRIHTNFAHHRDGVLRLLDLPPGAQTERAQVSQALGGWSAESFEEAAADRGLVCAAVRTPEEWQRHPQAAAVAALPLVAIDCIAAASCLPLSPIGGNDRPLAGLRVLDLTRILAGPIAGRTLAAYGAEVMLVNSPQLPNIAAIAETSRGKLSTHLDLSSAKDCETLRDLIRQCDVFLQGYRPGGLDDLGFGPEALAKIRPGIVCVSLSAYGHQGPWASRRGFDSLVQAATGINVSEAEAFGDPEPRALPLQALDYGAAYLLAFGASAALWRQRTSGGSWHVRVSLAGVSRWLSNLGRLADGPTHAGPLFDGGWEESASGFGRLTGVPHAARFSHSPSGWIRPSMPPGSHPPEWPAVSWQDG